MVQLLCTAPPLQSLHCPAISTADLRCVHGQLPSSSASLRRVYFKHPSPSADPSAVLRRLCSAADPSPAVSTLLSILERHPDSPSLLLSLHFPSLFSALSRLSLLPLALQLHALSIKLPLPPSSLPHLRNSLLSLYSSSSLLPYALKIFLRLPSFDVIAWNSMLVGLFRSGEITHARKMFDEMPKKTVITWSIMISGYLRNGMYVEAMETFREMQTLRVRPNAQILVSLLGACGGLGALEQGEWVCQYIKRNHIKINSIMLTAIIDMYCKCGHIDKAVQVFKSCPTRPPLSSWNSMMFGLAVHGYGREAMRLFKELEVSGLVPDDVSFLGVLTACNHTGMVDEARNYFAVMRNGAYDIEVTVEHYSCMVDLLGRAGLVEEAERLIREMPMEPDVVIWGSLLSACRSHGNLEIGRRAAMRVLELDPEDSGGYVLLANTYAQAGEFGESVGARSRMKERGVTRKPGCSAVEIDGVVHEFV